jgi:hypothetical protein
MRARHRVSKLLLRQGIVHYGGQAWTGTHLVWLRNQHFGQWGPTKGSSTNPRYADRIYDCTNASMRP